MKEKISSWFSALGGKLVQFKNWLIRTKFWALLEKIVHYIGVGLYYIFYPITWILHFLCLSDCNVILIFFQ